MALLQVALIVLFLFSFSLSSFAAFSHTIQLNDTHTEVLFHLEVCHVVRPELPTLRMWNSTHAHGCVDDRAAAMWGRQRLLGRCFSALQCHAGCISFSPTSREGDRVKGIRKPDVPPPLPG